VNELNEPAACVFQTFVVIAAEACARFVAYEPVSGPEHRCGDGGTLIRRIVVNDNYLELDAILIQDTTQATLDSRALLNIGTHTEIGEFGGNPSASLRFTNTNRPSSDGSETTHTLDQERDPSDS
jgi:hypothetical protein